MDTIEKLGVLSADSRYDLACACGTNRDDHRRRGQEGPEFFPVRINTACRESLLKVPGFGPQTVTGIIRLRREGLIRHLEELGLKGKRLEKARPFVVCE